LHEVGRDAAGEVDRGGAGHGEEASATGSVNYGGRNSPQPVGGSDDDGGLGDEDRRPSTTRPWVL